MKPTKYFTMIVFAVVLCCAASAQETEIKRKDVPRIILAAFDKAYSTVKVLEWEKEIHGGKLYYEAETVDGKISRNLLYAPDGTLAQITEKVDSMALPVAVTDRIKQQYPTATIRAAYKVTHADLIEYSIALSGRGPKKIVANAEGTIVSTDGKTALERAEGR